MLAEAPLTVKSHSGAPARLAGAKNILHRSARDDAIKFCGVLRVSTAHPAMADATTLDIRVPVGSLVGWLAQSGNDPGSMVAGATTVHFVSSRS